LWILKAMLGSVQIAIATEQELGTMSSSALNSFTRQQVVSWSGQDIPWLLSDFTAHWVQSVNALTGAVVMLCPILSTKTFSLCAVVINTLVGTKQLCHVIASSATWLKQAWHASVRRQTKQSSNRMMVLRKPDVSPISASTKFASKVENQMKWLTATLTGTRAGVDHLDVNLLFLPDRLRDCYSNHLRLRKHLYLDRNQTGGESLIRRYSDVVIFLDYMMKLRAKMFRSDTSKFYMVMSKGTSVSVAAVK
jgi:hypothetical protein